MVEEILRTVFGITGPIEESCPIRAGGAGFVLENGVLRDKSGVSDADTSQVESTFEFLWDAWNASGVDDSSENQRAQYSTTHPDLDVFLASVAGRDCPLVFDLGCGIGHSSRFFLELLPSPRRFVGVEMSSSVDIACQRIRPLEPASAFVQGDFNTLPFLHDIADVVICTSVLHHTRSIPRTLATIAGLLAPGGVFAGWMGRAAPPIRQFSLRLVHEALAPLSNQEALEKLRPLTALGEAIGRLGVEITVPEDIDVLEIKAGTYDLHRFINRHILRMHYDPESGFDRLNYFNFDDYRPNLSQKYPTEEWLGFFEDAGLRIFHWIESTDLGLTVYARKP